MTTTSTGQSQGSYRLAGTTTGVFFLAACTLVTPANSEDHLVEFRGVSTMTSPEPSAQAAHAPESAATTVTVPAQFHPLVEAVRLRASAPDWDREDAAAVSWPALVQADKVLVAVAGVLPEPRVTADVDGSVALDWKGDRDWNISISLDGSQEVGYSGLMGGRRVYGVWESGDSLPPDLVALVDRVLGLHA